MMCINHNCLDCILKVLSLVMIIIQSLINSQINSQLPVSSMYIKKRHSDGNIQVSWYHYNLIKQHNKCVTYKICLLYLHIV